MDSSQPTIFHRRSARPALELSRNFPTITVPIRSPGMANNSPVTLKKPSEGRSRRSTVTGFLPMPPISASPVCTPTTSTSSRDFAFGSDRSDCPSAWSSTESYITALSSSPSSRVSAKWISAPSTPPPKLSRRSVTCVIQGSQSSPFSPSSSFPAFMPPHVDHVQRRNSVPAMSARSRASSDLYPSVGRHKVRNRPKESNIINPPTDPPDQGAHLFTRPRPFYEIAHQIAMDCDDTTGQRTASASTIKPPEDKKMAQEKSKDDTRRYHALQELLSTEVSYLEDLKVLVLIYLRQIPTLTLKRSSSSSSTFGRNSSLSALSRASSSVHLSNSVAKESTRHIFKNSEVDALTRNAEEVLQFHEHFVEELRTALAPFGFRMELSSCSLADPHEEPLRNAENIDAGIAIVSTKFATEASRFISYEQFCAGHPEAMDILRRVQHAHSTEWEAFEQKCGASAYEMLNGHSSSEDSHTPAPITEIKPKSRRNSTASIDSAARYVRSRSNSLAKERDKESWSRSRLTFTDYLIKPVQRICKYPLLLDQLRTSKTLSGLRAAGRSDVVTENAAQAMRHVTSAVDEARWRQNVAVRSALVASRIVYPPVISSSSQSVLQTLTPGFLSSLGVCYLAGSLDVIHQQSPSKATTGTTTIHVKYLGAFLYRGGYLILAKVAKGKTYEPRHWFRLCDFKVVDVVESEAWLPHSFRLSGKGHEFEFASACQQEKELWLTAIRESLTYPVSGWINEPRSSIFVDGKGEMIPSALDGPFEAIVPLPTINSVPELTSSGSGDQPSEIALSASANESSCTSPVHLKEATAQNTERTPGPSRQSSYASFRLPSPAPSQYETFIIRRNLPSSRIQIDAGLHDVLSEACLSLRANRKEGELFQAPSVSRPGSPTRTTPSKSNSRMSTNSGLNMAKNRLRKHESVRVPRRKAQSSDDLSYSRVNYASRTKSLSSPSRPKTFSLVTHNSDTTDPLSMFYVPDSSPSQCPSSGCSSNAMHSNPPSRMGSPTLEIPSFMNEVYGFEPDRHRGRPSSFVGSIRSLFVSRPPSPTSPVSAASPIQPEHKPPSKNAFKRWVRNSTLLRTHRRTLSDNTSLHHSSTLPEFIGFGEPLQLVQSPELTHSFIP
ncbi:hypothetical protein GYMLUDRAFT_238141 [Collybiopsis luxurians FD-317 M1]|nr:hypothetical protein GYMLUDRAFT_238141 [Collybiopsis luxurians FD-317 M1]